VDGVGREVEQEGGSARLPLVAAAPAPRQQQDEEESYQCTPRMRWASATCSVDARSSGSFLPLDAAESGKTL
jgi:hypothetical protein